MKSIFTLLGLVCTILSVDAQGLAFDWIENGAGNKAVGYSIATDHFGNNLSTGYYIGTVDFMTKDSTPSLTSVNLSGDIFIQKLDASGNLLWIKSIGGLMADYGQSISSDSLGNVYITGFFYGTVDFDPSTSSAYALSSAGESDIFILKLDKNGDFIWAIKMGGTGRDFGMDIVIDPFGNILLSGEFSDIVDFDPSASILNITSNGAYDAFIERIDPNGKLIWVRTMGGVGYANANADRITTDSLGNVFTSGFFAGTVDFDPGTGTKNLISQAGYDRYILKLDTNGNYAWVGHLSGSSYIYGAKIISGKNGNIYLAGSFTNSADLDPGIGVLNFTANGGSDSFIEKLNANGDLIWVRTFGSTGADGALGLTIDSVGNVYTVGSFSATVDFDPSNIIFNLTASGKYDIYFQKLDSDGNFIWAKQMGGPSVFFDIDLYSIAIDRNDNLYTTGNFKDIVDFNPSPSIKFNLAPNSYGDWNFFVHKMSACGPITYSNFSLTVCDSFNLDGHIYTSSGLYSQAFTNSAGCDSIVTFNLTVKYSSSANLTTSACDSIILNGQTYNSSGTYTQGLINSQGCDSILTIKLMIHQVDTNIFTNGQYLYSTSQNSTYQWLDCDHSFDSIPGATKQMFYPIRNGNYAVSIRDTIYGCSKITPCTNLKLYSNVWPGDANNDSIVNNVDLLQVGLYYGFIGSKRSVQGNLWQPDSAANWGYLQLNGSDVKHVNCNGDSIIDKNDTLAINININSVHAIVTKKNDLTKKMANAPYELYFVLSKNSYKAGDWVDAEIWAGSSSSPIYNLYGISFDIDYASSLVKAGTESISYPTSWLGDALKDIIKIGKVESLSNTAFGAISRINHTNVGGYGKIADFKFQINTAITTPDKMHLSFNSYKAIDASGSPIFFNTLEDTIFINQMNTSMVRSTTISRIVISPNPFTSQTAINFSEEQKLSTIKIIDLFGRIHKEIKFSGYKLILEKEELSPGVYFIQIFSGDEIIKNIKFIIQEM